MAYQEGQYISQFMNTLPTQLAGYAQQQEQTRQFDALQGLRVSAEERALAGEARTEEQYGYGKEQRSLIDLLLQEQRSRNIDIAEAEERKTKALEGRGWLEKMYQLGSPLMGMGKPTPFQYQNWTETEDEWAQRITGYGQVDRGAMELPEGLQLDPSLYQYINQLSGYNTPTQNLLSLIAGGR